MLFFVVRENLEVLLTVPHTDVMNPAQNISKMMTRKFHFSPSPAWLMNYLLSILGPWWYGIRCLTHSQSVFQAEKKKTIMGFLKKYMYFDKIAQFCDVTSSSILTWYNWYIYIYLDLESTPSNFLHCRKIGTNVLFDTLDFLLIFSGHTSLHILKL